MSQLRETSGVPLQLDPHELEWDDAKVKRFWDFASSWEPWQEDYFTRQVGPGIVAFLKHVVDLKGPVLDYGCGPGYLEACLLNAGVRCEAVDFSPQSVDAANARFGGNSLWGGAKVATGGRLPYPDASFSLVLCIETIEHVLPHHLEPMLAELRRILRPDTGKLFVSTPHDENLKKNAAFCPECGSIFHRVEHVRSFSRKSLADLMARNGFTTEICDATVFNSFQEPLLARPLDWSPRRLWSMLKDVAALGLDACHFPGAPAGGRFFARRIGSGHHLFWLGRSTDRK